VLASLGLLVVAVVAIEAAIRAWRQSTPAPWFAQLGRIAVLLVVVTSAGGLGILLAGGGPREPLHYLYAALAMGALPVTDSFARRSSPRRRALLTFVGAVVLFVLIARLFQTG
jgi:hypothetical protein